MLLRRSDQLAQFMMQKIWNDLKSEIVVLLFSESKEKKREWRGWKDHKHLPRLGFLRKWLPKAPPAEDLTIHKVLTHGAANTTRICVRTCSRRWLWGQPNLRRRCWTWLHNPFPHISHCSWLRLREVKQQTATPLTQSPNPNQRHTPKQKRNLSHKKRRGRIEKRS